MGSFTQDAKAHLHANLRANPLMLLASCVNTPIEHNVFYNLHVLVVARCSASCMNWAQSGDKYDSLPNST